MRNTLRITLTGREVAVQQVSIARVFALARGLDDHVPGQAQTPHRDENEQQDSPEQVTCSNGCGDGRHRDETHAPRGVDDVYRPIRRPMRNVVAWTATRIASDAAETTTKFIDDRPAV